MRRTRYLALAALVSATAVTACAAEDGDSSPVVPTAVETTAQVESETMPPPEYDVVLLGDTIAQRDWVPVWRDLVADELRVDARFHQLSEGGKIDYDEMLADPDVREALQGAELIFISPEADYLLDECPLGSAAGCVDAFTSDYRASWSRWLDDIEELSDSAPIRSVKTWAWVVPVGRGRDVLVSFMDEIAAETVEHGGLVADLNATFTGVDHQGEPPAEWIDEEGHPLGPANAIVAQLVDDLGYASTR